MENIENGLKKWRVYVSKQMDKFEVEIRNALSIASEYCYVSQSYIFYQIVRRNHRRISKAQRQVIRDIFWENCTSLNSDLTTLLEIIDDERHYDDEQRQTAKIAYDRNLHLLAKYRSIIQDLKKQTLWFKV